MKIKLFKCILGATFCIFGTTALLTLPTFADDNICNNPNISDEIKAASGCPGKGNPGELRNTIIGILNAIIAVAGIVAVVYVIIGGINYMTSSGDANKIQKAKNTILYALIGLVICALSFAIVNWAIGAVNTSSTPTPAVTNQKANIYTI